MSANSAAEVTLQNNSWWASCNNSFASEMLYYTVREMWSNLVTALNQKTQVTSNSSCGQWAANSKMAAVLILNLYTRHYNFSINTERSFFQLQVSIIINLQKPMQFHITADTFSMYFLCQKNPCCQPVLHACIRKANCNTSKHGWAEGMLRGLLRRTCIHNSCIAVILL